VPGEQTFDQDHAVALEGIDVGLGDQGMCHGRSVAACAGRVKARACDKG
jgi:hypothetical protein